MHAVRPAVARPWAWFGAWLLLGTLWMFALVAILSVGLYLLPVAVVATVLLARRVSGRAGLPGLVSGLGAPVLYVAYLNRRGPGEVCSVFATGSSCVQEWDPWPWLIVGLAFVAFGIVLFGVRGRPRRQA
ncbi:MAG: hypothetical protein ACLPUG_01790 [Acidimicrobiales bacterium]|jgi:hypothetical protein